MDLFKVFQRQTVGGYDTFGTLERGLRKSGKMNRMARRRLKRKTEHEKFYEGFEEFVKNNRNK